MQQKTKILLVTKEESAFPKLKEWCLERGLQFITQPFITIEPVESLTIPVTDWIFFSSPKGARAYLKHYTILAQKVGVYGTATRKEVEMQGKTIQFCGSPAYTPVQIGHSFNEMLNSNDTVLFPISQLSKKSISGSVTKAKTISLVTYQTVLSPTKVTIDPTIILFTSPSNFESYISVNPILDSTILIAMGKTTEATIQKKLTRHKIYTLESPNEAGIIEVLEKL